jgi:hypothetical protein
VLTRERAPTDPASDDRCANASGRLLERNIDSRQQACCLTGLADQRRLDQPRRKCSDIVDKRGRRGDEPTLVTGCGGLRFGIETAESKRAPSGSAAELLFWVKRVPQEEQNALELSDLA